MKCSTIFSPRPYLPPRRFSQLINQCVDSKPSCPPHGIIQVTLWRMLKYSKCRDMTRPAATVRDQSRQESGSSHAVDTASDPQISRGNNRTSENESRDMEERQGATGSPELESKIKKLEGENLNLAIDNRGKEAFIT